jgi:tetratricopeptide (TPR) repeat protein
MISNKVIAIATAAILTLSVSAGKLYSQDFNSALKLLQSERYEDAANAFKQVIEKEPSNGDAFFYYGETVLKNYQTDPLSNSLSETVKEANSLFAGGVKADSTNGLNYVGLGMVVLLEKGDTVAADKYFKKAEQTLPKRKKSFTDRNFQTLIKLGLSELYAKNPRYTKSEAYLNKAIEFNDKNTDAYIALGDVYLDQNRASDAVAKYNKAIYINAKLAEPLVKIGNLYMRSRNLNQARENYEKAKEIDSTYAPLYKGLGEMFSLGGQPKFATQNYKKYFALSGNNIPAQKQLVNALFKGRV